MGGHFLLEVMSYGRICLTGGHILLEACLKGGHILEVDMSYRRVFFWMTYKYYRVDMSYSRTYLTEEHVLLEDVSYWKTCLVEINVLLEDMSYWIKYLAVGDFFLEDISYWRTPFINYLFIHLSTCPLV